jgi:hypothetical protein
MSCRSLPANTRRRCEIVGPPTLSRQFSILNFEFPPALPCKSILNSQFWILISHHPPECIDAWGSLRRIWISRMIGRRVLLGPRSKPEERSRSESGRVHRRCLASRLVASRRAWHPLGKRDDGRVTSKSEAATRSEGGRLGRPQASSPRPWVGERAICVHLCDLWTFCVGWVGGHS